MDHIRTLSRDLRDVNAVLDELRGTESSPHLLECETSPPVLDGVGAGLRHPRLKLLKLHGSVDWWWVPGDVSGMSLAREGVYGRIGSPNRLGLGLREHLLPGRERFIVPPLAMKSAYYRNPLTRQLWQEAYEAIREATQFMLIGYSLPVTDFVIARMLGSALGTRSVRLEVVD